MYNYIEKQLLLLLHGGKTEKRAQVSSGGQSGEGGRQETRRRCCSRWGAAVGTTTAAQLRPAKGETDEANLLSEEGTPARRGSFSEVELPVRSKLGAASRDPDVWRAKADEVPPWVAPSSVGKV